MKRLSILAASAALLLGSTASAWAAAPAALNLHAEPNATSKIVESVASNTALIPIYQKNGWSKVGNPANGTTGWIESKWINNSAPVTQVIQTQDGTKTITTGQIKLPHGNGHYEVIQTQSQLSPEKSKEMAKQMQAQFAAQQAQFEKQQQAMNALFNQAFQNMNAVFENAPAHPTVEKTEKKA